MERLVLNSYEAAVVFVPFLMLYLLRRRNAAGRAPFACLLVFAVYLFGVFHVTSPGTLSDLLRHPPELRADFINLLPFSDFSLRRIDSRLNVLLFVPLGFLLPLCWPQYRKPGGTICFGFCFSLLIELSQLLNVRRTDVDDLILNTLGAAIGYGAFLLFRKLRKRPDRDSLPAALEPVWYTIFIFAFRFFAYREFCAAKWLYGF